MTRKELAGFMASRLHLEIPVCEAFLTATFTAIARALSRGEEVELTGLGAFKVHGDGEQVAVQFEPSHVMMGFLSHTAQSQAAPSAAALQDLETELAVDVDCEDIPEVAIGESGRFRPPLRDAASTVEIEDRTELSSLAEDLLGLDSASLESGLKLDPRKAPALSGQRTTFPVKISHQMKSDAQRAFRPADGEERRSFKNLTLKNFFLNLGSVVRERDTLEPMIVFDANDHADPDGERYTPRLLRVEARSTGPEHSALGVEHNLTFKELDFDCERHEVLMLIDPQHGPRPHCFEIGDFRSNDRRQRAEVCLAQEYERYRADMKR